MLAVRKGRRRLLRPSQSKGTAQSFLYAQCSAHRQMWMVNAKMDAIGAAPSSAAEATLATWPSHAAVISSFDPQTSSRALARVLASLQPSPVPSVMSESSESNASILDLIPSPEPESNSASESSQKPLRPPSPFSPPPSPRPLPPSLPIQPQESPPQQPPSAPPPLLPSPPLPPSFPEPNHVIFALNLFVRCTLIIILLISSIGCLAALFVVIVGTSEELEKSGYAPLEDEESRGTKEIDLDASASALASAPAPETEQLRSPAPSARSVRSDRSIRSVRSDRSIRSVRSDLSRATPTVIPPFSPRIERLRQRMSRGYLLTETELAELEAEVVIADAEASSSKLPKVPALKVPPLALMSPPKPSCKVSAETAQYEKARSEAKAKRVARGLSA